MTPLMVRAAAVPHSHPLCIVYPLARPSESQPRSCARSPVPVTDRVGLDDFKDPAALAPQLGRPRGVSRTRRTARRDRCALPPRPKMQEHRGGAKGKGRAEEPRTKRTGSSWLNLMVPGASDAGSPLLQMLLKRSTTS